jgi:iron(III) transport system ATP-binding protein
MAKIRIVDLEKHYRPVAALRGISATIENGELLALLGPSGCGKTTTLQILAGFLTPDRGEVWADDRLISSPRGVVPPERRNMTMVFQSYALWPHMTVEQNVAFGLEMRRLPRDEIAGRVGWVLGVVNLAGYGRRYPHELSGGQQQRVALARALVVEPDTLLLDEPLSNLDANLRDQMRFEIRRIHRQTGLTMVYVTHDQTEAMVIADRIAVMNNGLIEQIGTPREIHEAPASRFVALFIGSANCLDGQLVGEGEVRCGELVFRAVPDLEARPGDRVTLCVRPSVLRVVPGGDGSAFDGSPGTTVGGRALQLAYLGDQQDLRIELDGGFEVRALAPATLSVAIGDPLRVHFPLEGCRIVRN